MKGTKKFILTLFLFCFSLSGYSQDFIMQSAGESKTGQSIVNVLVYADKKEKRSSDDLVKLSVVRGVMFQGIFDNEGRSLKKSIFDDPNIEKTRSDFFEAFFRDGIYRKYANIVGTSLSAMKNKKTKKTEITAQVIVDREALIKYLETAGVLKGFSNLW